MRNGSCIWTVCMHSNRLGKECTSHILDVAQSDHPLGLVGGAHGHRLDRQEPQVAIRQQQHSLVVRGHHLCQLVTLHRSSIPW